MTALISHTTFDSREACAMSVFWGAVLGFAEGSREQELERLLQLGARQVADRRRPDGSGWVVLTDPEGNEFCILRSDA